MTKFNNLTGSQKVLLKERLERTNTMEDFLNVIHNEFDLTNCKVGMVTGKMLAAGMVNTILPMVNPTLKVHYGTK